MQTNPLAFNESDESVLRADSIARHGTVLGAIVADATASQRRLADHRHAEMVVEHAEVMKQIAARQGAAGQTRMELQEAIERAYAPYRALLEKAEAAEMTAHSDIAALVAKSQELKRRMLSIVQPRLAARELHDVAVYNSMTATVAREANIKFAPIVPPMSDLARINFGAK